MMIEFPDSFLPRHFERRDKTNLAHVLQQAHPIYLCVYLPTYQPIYLSIYLYPPVPLWGHQAEENTVR